MRDRELYQTLLGLMDPWDVVDVEVELKERSVVVVYVAYRSDAEVLCPECGGKCPRHDARTRSWRHLDTMQYRMVLTAEVPRSKCDEHGVGQVKIPWAEEKARFTALFVCLVIDWLHDASIHAVAEMLDLTRTPIRDAAIPIPSSAVLDSHRARCRTPLEGRLPPRVQADGRDAARPPLRRHQSDRRRGPPSRRQRCRRRRQRRSARTHARRRRSPRCLIPAAGEPVRISSARLPEAHRNAATPTQITGGDAPMERRPHLAADPGQRHFLYFSPLPHGQGSFRPTLDINVTYEVGRGLSSDVVMPGRRRGRGCPRRFAVLSFRALARARRTTSRRPSKSSSTAAATRASKLNIGPKKASARARTSKKKTTVPIASAWRTAPRPLDAGAPPCFPTEALPIWLRTWVEAQAVALQVPTDLPGLISLSVLATACAGTTTVSVRRGWVEPLNVFALVALPSGSRKSVLFEAATSPLVQFEAHLATEAAPALDAEQPEVDRELEPRLRLVADAPTVDGPSRAAIASPARVRPSISAPSATRVFVGDVTPERIGSLLAENGGRLAVLSDEGEVAEIISGRYGGSFEVFLKGHSGAPISIERVGRERVYVDRPALTLGLAVQPDVLRSLASKRVLRERGLLARFLVAVPPSNLGYRTVDTPPVPDDVQDLYETCIRALLAASGAQIVEGAGARQLSLSDEARRRLVEFEREVELMLRPGGELADLASWGSKLVGLVARIAGLFHLADKAAARIENDVVDETDAVAVETVDNAIAIGRFAIPHAKQAFGLAGVDARLEDARVILAWLKKNASEVVTRRDIHQGLRARFLQAADVDAPLDLLVEHGWLRPVTEERRSGPGRPGSARFELHPQAYSEPSDSSKSKF